MSDDWNDLERLWQSLPAKAAPAMEELRRQHRWRWASRAYVASEALLALAGVVAAVWLMSRGDVIAIAMGLATLVMVAVAVSLTIWARAVAVERADDPVERAMAMAIRRARVGVRLAQSLVWAVFAGLLFTALVTLVRALAPELVAAAQVHISFLAIGVVQLWMAFWLAVAAIYGRKRAADLARLEALAKSLGP